MKIAHLVCSFPPYQVGMGNSCFYQARELAKRGHQITVFTPLCKEAKLSNLRKAGEKIETLVSDFKIVRLKSLIKFGHAAFLPQIISYLKNFDLIHLHYPFFGAAEFIGFFKKPVILQYHMDVVGEGVLGSFFRFHTKFILPYIIKKSNIIICSTLDYIKNSNIADLYKSKPEKFREIPFGVDLDIFKPDKKDVILLNKYNLTDKDQIVLFVGGLDKAHYFKGVKNLIYAFARLCVNLPRIFLMIVGEGDLLLTYKKLAQNLGIRDKIIFAGGVLTQDLSKYYNLADIFVLPSVDQSESFGIVLLEAMACAKPVIASNLAGVRTIVDDKKTGLLVKPNDINDLLEKLNYLLKNKEDQEKFSLADRERAEEKYNWGKIIKRLEEVYVGLKK